MSEFTKAEKRLSSEYSQLENVTFTGRYVGIWLMEVSRKTRETERADLSFSLMRSLVIRIKVVLVHVRHPSRPGIPPSPVSKSVRKSQWLCGEIEKLPTMRTKK